MANVMTREEVERIAALAHLALTEEEKEMFARQLGEVLAYVDELRRVDTGDVPPTTHALTRHAGLRDDEPSPSLPRDLALGNAPEPAAQAGLFKVPKAIG